MGILGLCNLEAIHCFLLIFLLRSTNILSIVRRTSVVLVTLRVSLSRRNYCLDPLVRPYGTSLIWMYMRKPCLSCNYDFFRFVKDWYTSFFFHLFIKIHNLSNLDIWWNFLTVKLACWWLPQRGTILVFLRLCPL